MAVSLKDDFRARLDAAVRRVGRKAVTRPDGELRQADDESVSQGGLTKILSGERANPRLFTIKRIADAAGVTVGELLGETGFDVTAEDREEIERFISWAERKLLKTAPPKLDARENPNASPVRILLVEDERLPGDVEPRRAKIANIEDRRMSKRVADVAATPGAHTFNEDPNPPEREIPSHYYEIGARLIFKAVGDSMTGAGITPNDLLFVRPESDARAAENRIVVCDVGTSTYVKRLRFRGRAIHLVSENEKYEPMVVDEDAERFRLVGVVVGRSGYPLG